MQEFSADRAVDPDGRELGDHGARITMLERGQVRIEKKIDKIDGRAVSNLKWLIGLGVTILAALADLMWGTHHP
jgi:hypothetical protein